MDRLDSTSTLEYLYNEESEFLIYSDIINIDCLNEKKLNSLL
jgi:hypothetical protein